MLRIDCSDETKRWRFACPDPERHRNWRVVDGLIECRSCGQTYHHLVDTATGDHVARSDIEIVGRGADHHGRFGRPTVTDD